MALKKNQYNVWSLYGEESRKRGISFSIQLLKKKKAKATRKDLISKYEQDIKRLRKML